MVGLSIISLRARKNDSERAFLSDGSTSCGISWKRFRAENFEPAGYTLLSYAAVEVGAQVVEKSGSQELQAVIASLRGHQFDTVLGRIGFDDKGDLTAQTWNGMSGRAASTCRWSSRQLVGADRISRRNIQRSKKIIVA